MDWFKKKEKVSEKIILRLTPSEKRGMENLADQECNSVNGIIRKAINDIILKSK